MTGLTRCGNPGDGVNLAVRSVAGPAPTGRGATGEGRACAPMHVSPSGPRRVTIPDVTHVTCVMSVAVRGWPYGCPVADSPIGVFDSGYGGLTVMRAILDQLPHESVAYFGDTARAPYGPRPIAQTRQLALECLDRLVDHGVKVLVIACNTASAAVLHDARERYDVPVVEVIRPAVRRAAAATRAGRVGVISTEGTHASGAYIDAFAAAPHLDVVSQPCPRFVEFVEHGITGGSELVSAAHDYLDPLREHGVDTLVLGCTHYPLLTAVISYVMGDEVTLVSSAEETAKDVYRVLADSALLRPADLPEPEHGFTTTGDPEVFRRLAARFLGVGSRLGPVFTAPSSMPSVGVV